MSIREKILRLNLVVSKLRREPATFKELMKFIELESDIQGYNFVVSQRTFQRDIKDIYSLYNIVIKNINNEYRIISSEEPEIDNRILEAFDIISAFRMSERISKYVHFEKRNSGGTENLHRLMYAIKNNLKIKFIYFKFYDGSSSIRDAEPYALKEFKGRWYLIAKNSSDGIVKTFALDRLSELNIFNVKFNRPNNFSIQEYYKFSFGIITPEDDPIDIILSFTPFQGKYIKTMPLHESQEILVDDEKELRIKLKLSVTIDFLMELLSYGKNMKVISPNSLKEMIRKELTLSLEQYS